MLANILQNLLNGLGKVLGVLNSIDPTVRAPLAISFGAIAGALSRYYLTLWFARAFGTSFPYGSFLTSPLPSMRGDSKRLLRNRLKPCCSVVV